MSENNETPIIIKKGKKEAGHHGGAWKVAYADFVTAMMALFIVLWILGQSDEVKEAVAGYFQDPVGFKVGGSPSPVGGDSPTPIDEGIKQKIERKRLERERLEKFGSTIKKKLQENVNLKEMVGKHFTVEITDEGLKIELTETAGEGFFDVSTAVLNSIARKLLNEIGAQLAELNNDIIIEGHTDSRKYPGAKTGYSNYELSCDRANAARRALISGGLREEQIQEIRGWADNFLKNPDDPFSASNRRISIIVKFAEML